jgi:hypothetical protein
MGWIEFLIFLLMLVTFGTLLASNAALGAMANSAAHMRHVAHRRAMLTGEALRYAESKRTVVLATQTAESAVEAITTVTQAGHSVLAATAFSTLERVPLAKDATKVVRGVHDSIIDNVYDSITALNKGIGSALRRSTQADPKPAAPAKDEGPSLWDDDSRSQ